MGCRHPRRRPRSLHPLHPPRHRHLSGSSNGSAVEAFHSSWRCLLLRHPRRPSPRRLCHRHPRLRHFPRRRPRCRGLGWPRDCTKSLPDGPGTPPPWKRGSEAPKRTSTLAIRPLLLRSHRGRHPLRHQHHHQHQRRGRRRGGGSPARLPAQTPSPRQCPARKGTLPPAVRRGPTRSWPRHRRCHRHRWKKPAGKQQQPPSLDWPQCRP
mmetsp:Transcript_8558/g.17408  ORF Transcript_8558/g.17408 Transcript_8558/m.17408 type:complete len:209 (-) Transcript_8558:933-1559(-)